MKANLELLQRIWSEKGAPLGNVLLEADFKDLQLDILDSIEKQPKNGSHEYHVCIQKDLIAVYSNEDNHHILLFSQKLQKLSKSRPKTRRIETLGNQRKRSKFTLKWIEILEYLEERDCDWIFSLLKAPQECNSTNFARLFGYNSFFYRWFYRNSYKGIKKNVYSVEELFS